MSEKPAKAVCSFCDMKSTDDKANGRAYVSRGDSSICSNCICICIKVISQHTTAEDCKPEEDE